MEAETLLNKVEDYNEIDGIYDECINYLKSIQYKNKEAIKLNEFANKEPISDERDSANEYVETLKNEENEIKKNDVINYETDYKIENELQPNDSEVRRKISPESPKIAEENEAQSVRLRKLSMQLPKIIITRSNNSLNGHRYEVVEEFRNTLPRVGKTHSDNNNTKKANESNGAPQTHKRMPPMRGYASDYPKRLVSKNGIENVALISNVPYEKMRLLNDTFHTLINLRWRWIISGTIVLHFSIWLVFAVFWYITALAHYDFEPDPPKRTCVTGGKDFVTIFLASVEAQTTIGFGDRTIDEECPESIFLFIMQLILGTGLSGVLTCVVYAKMTRPEKLSRDGVGFSKKAVISMRDGKLCLMIRAWDLNYDHIISSEFSAHFVKTHRTKEGEVIRYYARSLELQQRQFLLWPLTLVHVIDHSSPLYHMTPQHAADYSYEITVSLKGASASMGTFTQSQTSYLPKEILWGYRFPPVVRYDNRKQKYLIEHKKLDLVEPIMTPLCSASQMFGSKQASGCDSSPTCPGTPSSFSDRISSFHLQRSSSFKTNIDRLYDDSTSTPKRESR